jgi:hypothetical protein
MTIVTPTFPFHDRDSYLAYRRDWRIQYRECSAIIRQRKREVVRLMKAEQYAGNEQGNLSNDRYRARRMMEGLMEAKAEAARQRDQTLTTA